MISYRTREARQNAARAHLSGFKQPRVSGRGRFYLDADRRLRRSYDEFLVSDLEITTPAVYMRFENEYESSESGLLLPKQVVASYFARTGDRRAREPLRLAGRVTSTYAEFKRFDVSTSTDIQLPKKR